MDAQNEETRTRRDADTASGLPKIRVAYRVLSDSLDFKTLAVLDP
jgi:hypothetical protein